MNDLEGEGTYDLEDVGDLLIGCLCEWHRHMVGDTGVVDCKIVDSRG